MKNIGYIQLNDLVLIAGLYGKENLSINNKIGRVEEIIYSPNNINSKFSAKINVDGEYYLINYNYLFKLNDLKINIDEHNLVIGNPTIYWITKHGLTDITALIDQKYQFIMVGRTNDNLYKSYLISGIC